MTIIWRPTHSIEPKRMRGLFIAPNYLLVSAGAMLDRYTLTTEMAGDALSTGRC